MNDDPSELNPLTPGYFLIGRPINSVPDPDLTDLRENTLSRWQLCQTIIQSFWKRWSQEYLSSLQVRAKWTTTQENAKPGDIILIKEENLPPTKWRTRIIERVYPNKDRKIRMATVRTAKGNYDRPIVKQVPLIVDTTYQKGGEC